MSFIQPDDLKKIPDPQILDVRTDIEHKEECLSCAHHHVPLDQLKPSDFMARTDIDSAKPLYILCKAGGRAQRAQQAFMEAGFTNCVVIENGIGGCKACQIETRTKIDVISLERQVRIIAGCVVLLGVILGGTVSPAFYWMSGIVGAALALSGITNWCGLALLLAKAPWNK